MNYLKAASIFNPVVKTLVVLALATGCAKESSLGPAAQVQENAEQSPNENAVLTAEEERALMIRGKIRADLAMYGANIRSYSLRHGGSFPKSLDDLNIKPRLDPYGNAYVYKRIDDMDFELWCLGADGKLGGEDLDADLSLQMVIKGFK